MSIRVTNLVKTFGNQRAVDDISFDIAPGQVVGLLGPNGAGKSTTMKMLSCYLPPTSGSAIMNGFDVLKEPMAVRKQLGYLPENNPLYLDMYVQEYLAFAAQIHHLGKQSKKAIEKIIDITGLTLERKKKIVHLSKGYRQRVGLAQAMLHDPDILILDEPTSGLDPNQLSEIRDLIKQIGREKTVVLSTHIMQEVQAICDRIIILNRGKVVADDTTTKLQQQLENRMVIRAIFKEPVEMQQLLSIQGVMDAKADTNGQWTLTADESTRDLNEKIFNFAKENNVTLLKLNQEDYSIEQVFKELTK